MDKILTFESFSDELDFEKYYYLVEDILLLEEATAGSVDNPDSKAAKMIKNKSKKSGIPSNILKKVYKVVAMYDSTTADHDLNWNDSAFYNSELLWKIYQRSTGLQLGNPVAFKTFDNGSKAFVVTSEKRSQVKLKDKEEVISPAAIYNSDYLFSVIE